MNPISEMTRRFWAAVFGVAAAVERALGRVCKVDVYLIEGDAIVRCKGRFGGKERVPLQGIKAWRVSFEMSFEIVQIELTDDTMVQWLDDSDSLRILLDRYCPGKFVSEAVSPVVPPKTSVGADSERTEDERRE